jgi:pimeloyl-ACP methyl ester carboxylesterase
VKQVIIVPGVGGQNPLDLLLKKTLCDQGFKTSILESDANLFVLETDYAVHDREINLFLKRLQNQLNLSPEPTALIGASLGGIFTAVAYSKNNELFQGLLKGMVTVVAGGPISEVVENSLLPQLKYLNYYREYFKYSNQSSSERHQSLIQSVSLDPVHSAQPRLSSTCLMYIADYDVIVPASSQNQLWSAWGKPEAHHVLTDHISAIVWVYTFRAQEISTFIKNLN